jgi:hypothetical protein
MTLAVHTFVAILLRSALVTGISAFPWMETDLDDLAIAQIRRDPSHLSLVHLSRENFNPMPSAKLSKSVESAFRSFWMTKRHHPASQHHQQDQ